MSGKICPASCWPWEPAAVKVDPSVLGSEWSWNVMNILILNGTSWPWWTQTWKSNPINQKGCFPSKGFLEGLAEGARNSDALVILTSTTWNKASQNSWQLYLKTTGFAFGNQFLRWLWCAWPLIGFSRFFSFSKNMLDGEVRYSMCTWYSQPFCRSLLHGTPCY